MGIRFLCPNGHKMNVKEFLAGQVGICPVCGVKMRIPTESTRPSSKKASEQAKEQTEAAPLASEQAVAPETTIALADKPAETPLTPAAEVAEATIAATASYPSTAATFAQSPAEATMTDPLASPESVVWYVRPPSGGQFGPATTEIMRSWLAQGRISPDTLVWREGWPQWKNANEVFPQFRAAVPMLGLAQVNVAASAAVSPVHPVHGTRLPSRKFQLITFGSLVGVFVVLLTIFLAVWMKR
jgi:hypothetical protein